MRRVGQCDRLDRKREPWLIDGAGVSRQRQAGWWSGTFDSLWIFRFSASNLRRPPSTGKCYLGMLNSICLFSFHFASATIDRMCYLGTPSGICLFSFHSTSATIGRICYLGTPSGICLFSFHSTSATIGRICYLGTPSGICLFSFHSASATIGRICYLGTPSGICLFSFHSASATIDRFTLSRHVRQTLPLWRLESLVCELARVPPSAGICCLGTLNSLCLFIFHFTSATIDRTCYLGTLNSICLFSFHSASATIGRICYLGTPNGICLFSFHFASCISHRWLDHALWARSIASGVGNLNLLCANLLAFHRQLEYVIFARSTESSSLHRPPSAGYAI